MSQTGIETGTTQLLCSVRDGVAVITPRMTQDRQTELARMLRARCEATGAALALPPG